MYRDARKSCGMSMEDACVALYIAQRTLSNYELGDTIPSSETALAMSRLYKSHTLTQRYCNEQCPIGKEQSYVVLDNVNLDLPTVTLKLWLEMREMEEIMPEFLSLIINKNSIEDFSEDEKQQFENYLQVLMDVEHNIETLLLVLRNWTDVASMVAIHNQKCIDRGYVK